MGGVVRVRKMLLTFPEGSEQQPTIKEGLRVRGRRGRDGSVAVPEEEGLGEACMMGQKRQQRMRRGHIRPPGSPCPSRLACRGCGSAGGRA